MPTHTKVVIATPNSNLLGILTAVVFRIGELCGQTIDFLEDAVAMIVLLLSDLRIEESVIVEVREEVVSSFCYGKPDGLEIMHKRHSLE